MKVSGSKGKPGSILGSFAYLYCELFRADWRNFWLILLRVAGAVGEACLLVWLPKLMVGLVTAGAAPERLVLSVTGVCALLLLARMGFACSMPLKNQCLKLRHILEERVLSRLCSTDYSNLEDPVYQGKIERAKELYHHWNRDACVCIQNSVNFVIDLLEFLILGGILATLHPLVVVLMILCSLIQQQAKQTQVRWMKKNRAHWEPLERKINYIAGLTCDFASAKDQRLYAAEEWLLPKCRRYMEERGRWIRKGLQRKAAAEMVKRGAFLLEQGVIYWLLIHGVLNGGIPGEDFAMYVAAALSMSSTLFRLSEEAAGLRELTVSITDYREVVEEKTGRQGRCGEGGAAAETPLSEAPSITFSHVSYSYPGMKKPAVSEINLEIRPGERIAIVGLNGAGKTTLVKLLCGLYRPTKGRILIGGIPSENWEPERYYRMFSVAFQDYVVMPGSIGENVACRGGEQMDRERVRGSLAQAGLLDRVEELPEGMDTLMPASMFRDGRNLSGGETQKLLLARAIYRDAPILILDEPTAALDAIAENELYQSYGRLTENRTSVYISHRLASTRFCDRILMMEGGRIIEEGSHEELMEKQGAYYQLFQIQSHYYQNDRTEEFSSCQDPSWEVSSYVSR